NLIAVWGIVPAGAATVAVAHRPATVKAHTYLAVLPRPAGGYIVVARDRSGHQVDSLRSDQLPPPVPNAPSQSAASTRTCEDDPGNQHPATAAQAASRQAPGTGPPGMQDGSARPGP